MHRAPGRTLLLAFGAVVASFLAATLYSQFRLVEIDTLVADIATTGLPPLSDLIQTRATLRRYADVVQSALEPVRERRPPVRDELRQVRERLDAELLPHLPDTQPAAVLIRRELAELDRTAARVLAHAEAHEYAEARARTQEQLTPLIALLDDSIIDLERRAVGALNRRAAQIGRIRRRSMWFAMMLDGLCVALTLVAGTLALRTQRGYTRVLETHGKLLERRSDELEQFAGRVAHDVLGPLSTVTLALQAALGDGLLDRREAMLQRGMASIDRVQQIVDGLLAFARAGAAPEPGARAEVRSVVNGVVEEAQELASHKGVEVVVEPIPPLVVACSPGVLHSMVSNLLRNALKYMGDSKERCVTVRGIRRDRRVRLEVQDTGPGIDPKVAHSIFEPYVRGPSSGQPGIGLGLATVKRIAESHGGQVGLRSAPGRGALFWAELPRAADTIDEQPADQPPAA